MAAFVGKYFVHTQRRSLERLAIKGRKLSGSEIEMRNLFFIIHSCVLFEF